jgi:hypothetical protein
MSFVDVDSDCITFNNVPEDVEFKITDAFEKAFGLKIAHTTGNNDTGEIVVAFEVSIPEERCDEAEELIISLRRKYKLGS